MNNRDELGMVRHSAMALAFGLLAVVGCKSEESVRETYRQSVLDKVKEIEAIDLNSAGNLSDNQPRAGAGLNFDVDSPDMNAVFVFRQELSGLSELIASQKDLRDYGYSGYHIPIAFFSATVNNVLGDPNTQHYITTVGAFERNLQAITRVKFIALITELDRTDPSVPPIGSLTAGLISGSIEGRVDVFALEDGAWIGGVPFAAASSKEVSTRISQDGSASFDEALKSDFLRNAKNAVKVKFTEQFPGTIY